MVNKIEFHEDGSIKSITFVEGTPNYTVAIWFAFINGWNSGNRFDAIKRIEELDRVR